jgi:DNA-binding beta-propeller fold protein YncE
LSLKRLQKKVTTPATQLGDKPIAVAISSDGQHSYVTDIADGTVTVTVIAISGD